MYRNTEPGVPALSGGSSGSLFFRWDGIRRIAAEGGIGLPAVRIEWQGTGGSAMNCRFTDLRCKEVINICDGCRLGYVGDVECQLPEGQMTALIVPGPFRFFGLFGRGEEYYIPWDCIRQVGDDIILVDKPFPQREPPRRERRARRRRL